MELDRYDIRALARELLELFQDFKLVQKTKTTMITSAGDHETKVEYFLEKK